MTLPQQSHNVSCLIQTHLKRFVWLAWKCHTAFVSCFRKVSWTLKCLRVGQKRSTHCVGKLFWGQFLKHWLASGTLGNYCTCKSENLGRVLEPCRFWPVSTCKSILYKSVSTWSTRKSFKNLAPGHQFAPSNPLIFFTLLRKILSPLSVERQKWPQTVISSVRHTKVPWNHLLTQELSRGPISWSFVSGLRAIWELPQVVQEIGFWIAF